jgi:hypothetical protein
MSIFNMINASAGGIQPNIVKFVGSGQGTSANGGSVGIDITSFGIVSGDLILVHHAVGEDNGDQTSSMTLTNSGFNSLTTAYGNDTYDVNHKIHYKISEGTESNSILSAAFPTTTSSVVLQVMVFRSPRTPTLTLVDTKITANTDDPVFQGAANLEYGNVVVCAACVGHILGEGTIRRFTSGGDLDQFITEDEGDTEDVTAGLGCKEITSETSFTPAQWTATLNTTSSASVATTLVIS